ncbi:hypothetical protein [Secundilactobacillus silagei]|nr:hypothetical protein [Secundilactobacillus silagei]
MISKTAINQYPIKVEDRADKQPAPTQPTAKEQPTFWTKMKHHLGL